MTIVARCPGYSAYEPLPSGETLVNGSLPVMTSDHARADLQLMRDRFGADIAAAAKEYQIPAVWFYGFIFAEASRKDWENSCSPCDENCGISSCPNNPICPTTGQPACAYGLLQAIPMTARAAGVSNVVDLVGNVPLALKVAAHEIRAFSKAYGFDLPAIAAAYVGGGPSCRGGGMFGFGTPETGDKYGRDGYASRVTIAANTAAAMGFGEAPTLAEGALLLAASPLLAAALGLAAGALGVYIYRTVRKP